MKRKNLFLFSVLVLFSYLTFFYVSCFSGLTDETGEVSFTFTEPMLTKIMSRDAGSDISDLMSGLGDLNFAPQNVKYQFTGYSSGIDEATQTPNSFILYLYEGGAYELYSLNLIQSISADFGKELSQIFSGQVSNFSELFKNALISKGEWTAASNYIDITEQQYRSSAATSGDLINVSSTVSIRFLLSKSVFDFDSHGGYHITFYNISTNYSDFPYEDEEDYGEGDDIPKIRVELTSGGKTYKEVAEIVQVEYAALGHAWFESPDMPDGQEKTYLLLAYSDGSYKIHELEDGRLLSIVSEGKWKQDYTEDGNPAIYIYEDGKSAEQIIPFEGDDGFEVMLNNNPVWFNGNDAEEELADFKYLPVSISFKNLPRGARAKVYAEIFVKSPHGKTMTIASGESTDFIIESNTVVNVKMKIRYDPDYPDDDDIDKPNDKKTVYFAQAMIPDAYLDVFNGGWLYFNAYDDNTYDIFGDIYDENIQPVEKRTFAKGIWEADEERDDFLHLYETEYYDFNQDKLVSEEEGGIDIDLSKKNFMYNGWSAVELHFKMSGYVEEEDPDTMLALYNFDYFGENNYSLYFVDKADASLDSSSEYNFGYKSNYGSSDMSFSYDKEGNVFALSCYYDSNLYRTIVTNNHSYEIPSSVLGTSDSLTSITIDRKKDNLYIYGYSGYQGEVPYFIYSWPKASLANMATSTKKYSLLIDSLDFTDDQLQSMFHSIKSFAVYNDQLYLPVISASTLSLIKADLSDAEYDETGNVYQLSITEDNISSYEIFEEPLAGYPKISDVLWQDDYLYVLIRDVSINDTWYEDPFRSRGALVRINVSDDDYDVLGWTNEPVDVSSAGIYFKKDSNWDSFYYEDADHTKLFVMDGTKQMEMLSDAAISSYYPTLIIPDGGDSLSEEAFYGPEKFIAIKPKKLVIADDGFAFYTNADGALTYRNVNRVVEVDLEDFAITNSTEVSVKFAGDASSSFSGDYTRDITKDHYIADSGNFYYGSGAYEGSIYDKDGETVNEFRGDIYFAIKCADSE